MPHAQSQHPSFTAAFDALTQALQADMQAVNVTLLAMLDSSATLIPTMARHILASGGKRLRPLLTLAAAHLCDYRGTAHIALACAVECIHTATLLHDDVIDESADRRGQATANHIWGNKGSVLVGDFLFARAFIKMVEAQSLPILDVLAQASSTIAEGEVLQLMAMHDPQTSEDTLMRIIDAKTAQLFEASTHISAILGGVPSHQVSALRDYGRNLGLAFQLVDDALDYTANAPTGKQPCRDFLEGKMTLPAIISFHSGASHRAFWENAMRPESDRHPLARQALDHVHTSGGISATLEKAQQLGQRAAQALDIFTSSALRDALQDLAVACAERNF